MDFDLRPDVLEAAKEAYFKDPIALLAWIWKFSDGIRRK